MPLNNINQTILLPEIIGCDINKSATAFKSTEASLDEILARLSISVTDMQINFSRLVNWTAKIRTLNEVGTEVRTGISWKELQKFGLRGLLYTIWSSYILCDQSKLGPTQKKVGSFSNIELHCMPLSSLCNFYSTYISCLT